MCLEAPKIEEAALKTVPDIHQILESQIINSLFEHHSEEDADGSRYHDTTLLHDECDGKRHRQVSIESDMTELVLW